MNILLLQMMGYASKKAAPILGEGGALGDVMNIVQDAGRFILEHKHSLN